MTTAPQAPKRHDRRRPADQEVRRASTPPMSIEAEQAVLGGLMLAQEMWDVVSEKLHSSHFYRRDHALIWDAMSRLAEDGQPFDAITLGEWFEAEGKAELIGGGSYLVELASTTPSAANISAYADIVYDRALLRQVIETGSEIVNTAFNPGHRPAEEIVAEAEQALFAIGQGSRDGASGPTSMFESAREVMKALQAHYEAGGGIVGLPTGYTDFDRMTLGLQPTDLVIVAGRPAMGKTTFALNIAEYVAAKSRKAVAVFSMEMSKSQLTMRSISSIGRVNATRLRSGELEDEDWARVATAIKAMRDAAPILIDDTGALTPDRLRAKARRLMRENPDLGLIVIDYLQLMTVAGGGENRATEISEISRQLKALAKELKVPVIALSQLNRGLETRTDKRPMMADLRDSGAIEQDADTIVFVYRDEYYNPDSPDKGLAEIIIGKQRSGPTGTSKLRFEGEYTKFSNLRGADSFEATYDSSAASADSIANRLLG